MWGCRKGGYEHPLHIRNSSVGVCSGGIYGFFRVYAYFLLVIETIVSYLRLVVEISVCLVGD